MTATSGGVISNVVICVTAAVLPLAEASCATSAPTATETSPKLSGFISAVYISPIPPTLIKLLRVEFVSMISVLSKPLTISVNSNVTVNALRLFTLAGWFTIATSGAMVSITITVLMTCTAALPAASLTSKVTV